MSHDLTDADYATLADFRFSLRQFLAFSEKEASRSGLTAQQHQALLAIRAAPGKATIGYVAERLILKPHSATGLVDRLEALDLVRRRLSETDRRQTLLELTTQGHSMLAGLSVAHRNEILRMRPMLIELLAQMER